MYKFERNLKPYLQLEDLREDILHFDPVEDGHRSVRPHPVHDRTQLEEERNQHETFEEEHVHVRVTLAQEVTEDT